MRTTCRRRCSCARAAASRLPYAAAATAARFTAPEIACPEPGAAQCERPDGVTRPAVEGGTRKDNPHLKAMLVATAISASRTKGSYLRDKFHRLRVRMGAKKAAVAVAHKILVAAFHMLQRAVAFADLGADYLDRSTSIALPSAWSAASMRSATTSRSAPRRPQPDPS